MNLRDFRIGWRHLIQEPVYSLAVLLGLGIGLATCLLLLGFVRYSLQYNSHIPNAENLYVVNQRFNVDPKSPILDQAPLFLRPLASQLPGVVSATGYVPSRPLSDPLTLRVGHDLKHLNALTVLDDFPATLGIETLQGDIKSALEKPDSFAITEETAQRLFGTSSALGRTVEIEGKLLQVGAILRTQPPNTTIPFEALFGVQSVTVEPDIRNELMASKKGWWGKLLLHVRPDASLPTITDALQQAVDRSPALQNIPADTKARLGSRKAMEISLSSLRYAYFDYEMGLNQIASPGERANPVVTAGLAAMAILILMLAAINYVNLATVRVIQRQREIAVRKVLGGSVGQIMLHFLAESLFVCFIATSLGLLLAWLSLPLFSTLVNRDLQHFFTPVTIGIAYVIGGLLGIVTALYPAWVALRVSPTQALAGRPNTESIFSRQLRRVLTVLQVSTAMGFVGVALAITYQTEFAIHADAGFDPASILIVDLSAPVKDSEVAHHFMTALSAQPGVAGIAISGDAVGRLDTVWIQEFKRPGGTGAQLDLHPVSVNFFEQYGIKPIAGRLFESRTDKEDDAVPLVLNAIAAHDLGFASPEAAIGQIVQFSGFGGSKGEARVVGIAPELRFRSLHETPMPSAYELDTNSATLSIRASGSLPQVENEIQSLWPKYYPDTILRMHRARDLLDANYAEESRMATLLSIATAIALAIAAFGTFVLSANTVQRRAKEIVLRKLHGARRSDIGMLVFKEIGALTAASALIGLPVAAVTIARYLSTYVEHAPAVYWSLLLAPALTLAIILLAIVRHARIAVRMSPADALRE